MFAYNEGVQGQRGKSRIIKLLSLELKYLHFSLCHVFLPRSYDYGTRDCNPLSYVLMNVSCHYYIGLCALMFFLITWCLLVLYVFQSTSQTFVTPSIHTSTQTDPPSLSCWATQLSMGTLGHHVRRFVIYWCYYYFNLFCASFCARTLFLIIQVIMCSSTFGKVNCITNRIAIHEGLLFVGLYLYVYLYKLVCFYFIHLTTVTEIFLFPLCHYGFVCPM